MHPRARRLDTAGQGHDFASADSGYRAGSGAGLVFPRVGFSERPRLCLWSRTDHIREWRSFGEMPTGTAFFRDFPPGTYSFTVEPIGLPTPQAANVQLAAGTQNYLQIQWVASWQFGYPEVDFSFAPNTFGVLTASPQVAEAYLPTLTYLGQR
jgi:hypothetical protein